jgi:hypothetical protein
VCQGRSEFRKILIKFALDLPIYHRCIKVRVDNEKLDVMPDGSPITQFNLTDNLCTGGLKGHHSLWKPGTKDVTKEVMQGSSLVMKTIE